MKNILITGMTAPQASTSANERSLAFAGLVKDVLQRSGHNVVMKDPSMSWTLDELDRYDAVILGIAPITSLSASKAYGALHVARLLWYSEKLTLLVDSPRPASISASLRAIIGTPENLVKPFYAVRRGYQMAREKEHFDNLMQAVNLLHTEDWPDTMYPALPWSDTDEVMKQLPENARSLIGVNLDAHLIADSEPPRRERVSRWLTDTPDTPWIGKVSSNLRFPIERAKQHRSWDDARIENEIAHSTGVLVSPDRSGTWWSHRFMQCMNAGTPVATEWRESGVLGKPWSVLASSIEDMSTAERTELSWEQTAAYITAVPDKNTAARRLEVTTGLQATTKEAR